MENSERDLQHAAQELSLVLAVAGRAGFQRGRRALAHDLLQELTGLCQITETLQLEFTDDELRELAGRFRHAAELALHLLIGEKRVC